MSVHRHAAAPQTSRTLADGERAVKILMVSWEYPPVVIGGLGRHVYQLATALAADGHDVVVLSRRAAGTDPATQGAPAPLGTCPNGGVYTMCFSTGCLLKEAYNGMPVTCYCPIYTTTEPFVFPNGTGFSCTGESVGGTLRYVQSGCQYGCA